MTSEHSLLARCQPTTYSAVEAIRTIALRPSHMPSTWMTWWISSQIGATGHNSQNPCVRCRKVLAGIPISDCRFFDKSHSRNSSNSRAVLSYLCVVDAPQDTQRQRVVPALVVPLRFVLPPQVGHMIFFICPLKHQILKRGSMHADLRRQEESGHAFLPTC